MDLTPYIDNVRRELATAAEAGGDDVRATAERLAAALESATRLALLEALSAAADEITTDLAPGAVAVRLRGRDPEFVVTSPPGEAPRAGAAEVTMDTPPAASPDSDEGGGTSRITLRLPEHLKPRIDEAAGRMGLSVNAWLVRAVSAALGTGGATGRSGVPGPSGEGRPLGQRYTGWVR